MMLASTMVPLPEPQPLGRQMTVDLLEQALAQLVLFQEMAKVEDGGLVRHRFRQPQTRKPAHRLGLVQQSLPS